MSYKPVDRQILITTEAPTTNPPSGIVYQWVDNDGFLHQLDNSGNDRRYVDLNELSQKVATSDIVDNLTSEDSDKPLSANQGKLLQDNKEDADSTILKEGDVEDSLNSTSTTKPLSANQGSQLETKKINSDLSLNYGYVSEYTSRVMQEGGTIQNGRRTASPFISPTYEDAKMILNASGGLDIEEVDGRKVVNKVWDSSQEKENQEFAGSDRPEFHKTLDGFDQVCVEAERENLFTENCFVLSDWDTFSAEPVVSIGTTDTGRDIWRITTTGSNGGIGESVSFAEVKTITVSAIVRRVDNDTARLRFSGLSINVDFDISNGTLQSLGGADRASIRDVGEGFFHIEATATTDDFGVFGLYAVNSDSIDALYFQNEEAEYSTLPFNGTRLAPNTVIENALPDENGGTIAQVLTTLYDPDSSTNETFFAGSSSSNASLFYRNPSTLRFYTQGTTGGSISISDFFLNTQNYGSNVVAIVATYDDTDIRLMGMRSDGTIKYTTNTHQLNATRTSVDLGGRLSQRTSHYFEKPWYKDNIVRVNATDQEIKEFFEQLTLGTSMETKAENMTIVE